VVGFGCWWRRKVLCRAVGVSSHDHPHGVGFVQRGLPCLSAWAVHRLVGIQMMRKGWVLRKRRGGRPHHPRWWTGRTISEWASSSARTVIGDGNRHALQ